MNDKSEKTPTGRFRKLITNALKRLSSALNWSNSQSFVLRRLDAADARPEFSCDDEDLDEFFHKDSIVSCDELLAVTYVLLVDSKAVAYFCLSNDAIKREDLPRTKWKRIQQDIPEGKRYASMPAAKIGRLGVSKDSQRAGYGTEILDFLKYWFTTGNKTGCRFLVVDAYNTPAITAFYEANDFEFLTAEDAKDKTRIMYFDLIRFTRGEPEEIEEDEPQDDPQIAA